jgi:imidazolonepropionase
VIALRDVGRCVTCDRTGTVLDGAVIVLDGEKIAFVGREAELPTALAREIEQTELCGGALVTPGLVDAHTHPLYAGDRFAEIAARSSGAGYEAIAATGGGIAASVATTRRASAESLEALVRERLERFAANGTTTVEVKTGYHLDAAGELGDVTLLARLAREAADRDGHDVAASSLPSIEVTYLAAHAAAPELRGDLEAQTAMAIETSTAARAAGARHVDVFCDEGYFNLDQARRILLAGRAAGLAPRMHADELRRTGAAALAAELAVRSADHLLSIDRSDAEALAAAGVVATLAPVTALAMKATPPTRVLIDAGTTVALGSDHNPGTCGVSSMALVVGLAVGLLGMSVSEALVAATAGGAASLGRFDRGRIERGARADLVAWEADHEGAFAWSLGLRPRAIWLGGRRLAAPGSNSLGAERST